MMPFILEWLKIKTNFIKLIFDTFILGGGHFHSKVIGMLVLFLRYKFMILVF